MVLITILTFVTFWGLKLAAEGNPFAIVVAIGILMLMWAEW